MSESTKQGLKLKRFIKATATDCSASILNSEVTFHYQQPPSEHLWAGLYAFFCSDHLSRQMEWTALKCCWAQTCWRAQFSVFFILSYVTLILNEVFFWKRKVSLELQEYINWKQRQLWMTDAGKNQNLPFDSHAGIIAVFRISFQSCCLFLYSSLPPKCLLWIIYGMHQGPSVTGCLFRSYVEVSLLCLLDRKCQSLLGFIRIRVVDHRCNAAIKMVWVSLAHVKKKPQTL